mmetsp:Transcript_14268/g.30748  ORF Transcript_14268/g.30748 Transcript_14268/m.30748 type:complete len:314 (-) Transcript_14268:756-1697(-)
MNPAHPREREHYGQRGNCDGRVFENRRQPREIPVRSRARRAKLRVLLHSVNQLAPAETSRAFRRREHHVLSSSRRVRDRRRAKLFKPAPKPDHNRVTLCRHPVISPLWRVALRARASVLLLLLRLLLAASSENLALVRDEDGVAVEHVVALKVINPASLAVGLLRHDRKQNPREARPHGHRPRTQRPPPQRKPVPHPHIICRHERRLELQNRPKRRPRTKPVSFQHTHRLTIRAAAAVGCVKSGFQRDKSHVKRAGAVAGALDSMVGPRHVRRVDDVFDEELPLDRELSHVRERKNGLVVFPRVVRDPWNWKR